MVGQGKGERKGGEGISPGKCIHLVNVDCITLATCSGVTFAGRRPLRGFRSSAHGTPGTARGNTCAIEAGDRALMPYTSKWHPSAQVDR